MLSIKKNFGLKGLFFLFCGSAWKNEFLIQASIPSKWPVNFFKTFSSGLLIKPNRKADNFVFINTLATCFLAVVYFWRWWMFNELRLLVNETVECRLNYHLILLIILVGKHFPRGKAVIYLILNLVVLLRKISMKKCRTSDIFIIVCCSLIYQ